MPNEKTSTTPASAAPSHNDDGVDDGLAGAVELPLQSVGCLTCTEAGEPTNNGDGWFCAKCGEAIVSVELSLPSTPETVGAKLKRVYPEHYVRIITEANRVNGSEHTATTLGNNAAEYSIALAAMFIWDRAAEGHEFWCELAEREQT